MGWWDVRVPEQRGGHAGYLVGEVCAIYIHINPIRSSSALCKSFKLCVGGQGSSDREQGHRLVVHVGIPPRPMPGGLSHHAHSVIQLRPQAGQLLREQPYPQAAAYPRTRPPGLRRYRLRPSINDDVCVHSGSYCLPTGGLASINGSTSLCNIVLPMFII